MKALTLTIQDGAAFVDSRRMAGAMGIEHRHLIRKKMSRLFGTSTKDAMGIEHRHLIRTIRKHQERVEEFGKVCFKNAPSESGQETFGSMLPKSLPALALIGGV